MGTEFSWFYDVIALAVILVCLFFGAKKGFIKSVTAFVGFLLAVVLAFVLSSGLSGSFYENTVKSSNIKKISQELDEGTYLAKYVEYLENLDYHLKINGDNVEKIFASGENVDKQLYDYANNINGRKVAEQDAFVKTLHEGYAVVTKDIVSRQLSKYAAESAAEILRNPETNIDKFASLLVDTEDRVPAKYIAENYIADAYKTIIKLISFVIIMLLGILITMAAVKAFTDSDSTHSVGSHVMGGIIGILQGVILVFAVAAFVRLNATMGSNEMLFFNNEAVENTLAFKYVYEFITKL